MKEKLLKILKYATYKRPIKAKELGNLVGSKDNWDLSQPKIRSIITELIEEGYPIGSKGNGYFYIKHEKHLYTYVISLYGRISGIQKRIEMLHTAFYKKKKRKLKKKYRKRG